MSARNTAIAFAMLAIATGLWAAQGTMTLPPGTTIPIELRQTLDVLSLKQGDAIVARTIQRVDLPQGSSIPAGSRVLGEVMDVRSPGSRHGASTLAIVFDRVQYKGGTVALHAGLRAMASFAVADAARDVFISNDLPNVSVYRQIGGDYYYPDSDVYGTSGRVVGKATAAGVFLQLDGRSGNGEQQQLICDAVDRPEAVGVFSSESCGLYGWVDMHVSQSVSAPEVEIRFQSSDRAVKIGSSSVLLLQEVGSAQ